MVEVTDEKFRELHARERQQARKWARAFEQAARDGDVDRLVGAANLLSEATVDGWRLAMKRVARLSTASDEIRAAFANIWIESKMLPLRVGDRRTLANDLRVLMPSGRYQGEPLTLYRGAGAGERCRRLYGFSWTRDAAIAEGFAEHWRTMQGRYPGAVLLRAIADQDAVLLFRDDDGYYAEHEVVVDPFKLRKISIVRRLFPDGESRNATRNQTRDALEG